MAAVEEALKPLFNQWLEEAIPKLEERIRIQVMQELGAKSQQSLFNQKEMAKRQNVSVTTFRKWRVMGLKAEPTPTGGLMFDLNTVNQWKEENGINKIDKPNQGG
ncbi:hypothetical protein [Enterococcus sp. 5H]|uniref:hypothetical protein n=1 Tax=Enterococcus sp. 5H TaxID=1229490 RepID=UPI0023047A4C|nr:hypothetical protein [Enterococcus sp. 5H]MDA9472678.1 hypothetical protein [Enterococcus sp. 5H]